MHRDILSWMIRGLPKEKIRRQIRDMIERLYQEARVVQDKKLQDRLGDPELVEKIMNLILNPDGERIEP
jgi:hypothetical protein